MIKPPPPGPQTHGSIADISDLDFPGIELFFSIDNIDPPGGICSDRTSGNRHPYIQNNPILYMNIHLFGEKFDTKHYLPF